MKDTEKQPLLVVEEPGSKSSPQVHQPTAMAVQQDAALEHNWDGNLLSICGSFDHLGVSTFAYVKMLSPLAWGHNMQRATGGSFWKHALVFVLFFSVWGWFILGASSPMFNSIAVACDPKGKMMPSLKPMPKSLPTQQFLGGATLQVFEDDKEVQEGRPEDKQQPKAKPKEDGPAWEDAEGTETINEAPVSAAEQLVADQIQSAKLQAADSFAQLGAGRKLLHKHKHDDHHDKHKKEKKEKKMTKLEKASHDDEDEDVFKPFPGAEHYGPEGEECQKAQMRMGVFALMMIASTAVGILNTARARTVIRERFGIKGTKARDCAAWTFCGPCALCQETRTLALNNVHNGVWHGPTVLVASSQNPTEVPAQMDAPTKPVSAAA